MHEIFTFAAQEWMPKNINNDCTIIFVDHWHKTLHGMSVWESYKYYCCFELTLWSPYKIIKYWYKNNIIRFVVSNDVLYKLSCYSWFSLYLKNFYCWFVLTYSSSSQVAIRLVDTTITNCIRPKRSKYRVWHTWWGVVGSLISDIKKFRDGRIIRSALAHIKMVLASYPLVWSSRPNTCYYWGLERKGLGTAY